MQTVRLGTLRVGDCFLCPLTGRDGLVLPLVVESYEPGREPWIDEDNGISDGVLVELGPTEKDEYGYVEKVLHPNVRVYPLEEG